MNCTQCKKPFRHKPIKEKYCSEHCFELWVARMEKRARNRLINPYLQKVKPFEKVYVVNRPKGAKEITFKLKTSRKYTKAPPTGKRKVKNYEWIWYWAVTLEDKYFRERTSELYKKLDKIFHEERFELKPKLGNEDELYQALANRLRQ